jgi:hypothetical protein
MLLACGIVLCAMKSGIGFYTGNMATSLAEAERTRTISPLAENWGKTLEPAERERSSRAYAATAFISTGQVLNYFDQSGHVTPFVPSGPQLQERQSSVVFGQMLESTATEARSEGYRWTISCILALLTGIAIGTRDARRISRAA